MNWIEKHILSLDKTIKVHKSLTTDSVYYENEFIKIRYSSHFTAKTTENDISIVKSVNDNMYLVSIKDTRSLMNFKLQELKWFISSTYLTNKIKWITRKELQEINDRKITQEKISWNDFLRDNKNVKDIFNKLKVKQRNVAKHYYIVCGLRGDKFIDALSQVDDSLVKQKLHQHFKNFL